MVTWDPTLAGQITVITGKKNLSYFSKTFPRVSDEDQYLSSRNFFSAELTDYSNEETIGSFGKKKNLHKNFYPHFVLLFKSKDLFHPSKNFISKNEN